jgi:hypothetical protein
VCDQRRCQSIISYHVEGFNHAGDMAIVYPPKSKILVSADMGLPAAGTPVENVSPNSVALYNNIKRLKLDGNPSSNADFERTVGPPAARSRPAAEGWIGQSCVKVSFSTKMQHYVTVGFAIGLHNPRKISAKPIETQQNRHSVAA